MDKRVIISANNIGIGYPKTRNRKETGLYNDLSFNLFTGELVCLLGANGVGKSTLLRTISNSQPALGGSIKLDGKPISSLSKKKLSKLLGLVLTDKTASGGLKVRELVELGRYPYTGFFGQQTKTDKIIVDKAMQDVGIIHKADSYCAELSDGERQKAMIAKVLAQECPVILLDEPTAFLDITSRIEVTNLLHDLAIKHNKTILLSTHDIEIALLLADRLWLLSPKCGLQCGTTEDIVVSGKMDNFFDNKNIRFDRKTGNFFPRLKSDKYVFIESKGYLYHWTKNLLLRHGYGVADKEDAALFSIRVSAPDRIMVSKDNNSTQFSDFESLASYISALK